MKTKIINSRQLFIVDSCVFLLLISSIIFIGIFCFDVKSVFRISIVENYIQIIHSLTDQYIQQLQLRLLIIGVVNFVLAAILFFKRKWISMFLVDLKVQFVDFILGIRDRISSQFSKKNRVYSIGFLVVFSCGIIIRLLYIDNSLRYDEGFTFYHYSQHPFLIIMSHYDYPNNHIFHTLLVKLSTLIFGNSIVSLRLPALIFGVSFLPVFYFFVSKLTNKSTALIAVVFVSFSTYLIYYSVNARGYSILIFTYIVLLILVEKLLKRDLNLFWVLFVLIQVIGVYTIPTMLYCSFSVYLYFFFCLLVEKSTIERNLKLYKLGKSFLFVCLFSIVVYLPVYLFMGKDVLFSNEYIKSYKLDYIVRNIPLVFTKFYKSFTWCIPFFVQVIMIFGVLLSFMIHRKSLLLFLSILVLLLTVFGFQKVLPDTRMLAFIFPLFYMFSAIGIFFLFTKLPSVVRILFFISFISIFLFSIFKTQNPIREFEKPPIENESEVFEYFNHKLRKNDRVLFCFPLESSFYSYFSFKNISEIYFNNSMEGIERVFVVTSIKRNQSVNIVLKKNDIDDLSFKNKFKLIFKKVFKDELNVYLYRLKKN